MNENGLFTCNGIPCAIVYNNKNFYFASYKDDKRLFTDHYVHLFPVAKFSKGSQLIAFNVANLHVIPSLFYNK